MDFKLMKEIITVLKQQVKCTKCDKKFVHREIEIEDVEEASMTISMNCSRCEHCTQLEVDLKPMKEMYEQNKKNRKPQNLKVTAKKIQQITTDDVLEMRNCLKDFTGDFKKIFKN